MHRSEVKFSILDYLRARHVMLVNALSSLHSDWGPPRDKVPGTTLSFINRPVSRAAGSIGYATY
jgi:hypothetical protein